MLYTPAAFSQSLLNKAQSPVLSYEFRIYVSTVPALDVATIVLTAAATATLSNNPAVVLPDAGVNLQVAALTPMKTSAAPVVTISGTGVTNATLSGAATMARPSWVDAPRISDLRGGAAYDIVTTAAEKYKEGNFSLTSITNGGALQRVGLFWLPDTADWTLLGCTTGFSFDDNTGSAPKPIACGRDPGAYIKKGMKTLGSLRLSAKHRGLLSGLSMYAGQTVTLRVDVVREDEVITDRLVFTSVPVNMKMQVGEGDSEAVEEMESLYERVLAFAAPNPV